MIYRLLLPLFFMVLTLGTNALSAKELGSKYIRFDDSRGVFLLSTEKMSYGIGFYRYKKGAPVQEGIGYPGNLYWGGKLGAVKDLPNFHELTYHAWGHSSNARQSRWELPLFVWQTRSFNFEPALKLRTYPNTARQFR